MFVQKPKVVMLGWEFPPFINGGLGVACHHLAKALSPYCQLRMIVPKTNLSERPEEFEVFGLNQLPKAADDEEIEKEIVDVYLYPYGDGGELELPNATTEVVGDNPFPQTDVYGGDLYEKIKFYTQKATQAAMEKDFDIIHAHDWMTFPAALAIRSRSHKPLVLHVHSTTYDRVGPESKGWVYEIEKAAMQAADFVIPVSHYTAKILRDHYDVPVHKMIPVHNAVSIDLKTKGKKAFSEKLVSFVGRITHQKNPEVMLKVALKVWEQYDNVRFVMAGKGDLMPKMLEDVARNKVSNKFHFSGFLDRKGVEELLSVTDIFVMPSISDPFGIVALEAAHFSVPCIISRTSGVLEVLKGALTCESNDVDLIADYILMLLNDNELAEDIGKKGKDSIKSLTWTKSAQKVLEIYNLLLQKKERNIDDEI